MKEQKNIKGELHELGATKLAGLQGKGEGWDLPADYFVSMADEVMAKAQRPTVHRLPPKRSSAAWLRVAAAVVLLCSVYWWWSQPSANITDQAIAALDWELITTQEMEAYVDANVDEFMALAEMEENVDLDWEFVPTLDEATLDEYLESDALLDEFSAEELMEWETKTQNDE